MNGDLRDFPLPLLLSVLAKQSGVLSAQAAPNCDVSLTLHQGHLRHVHLNGNPVRSLSRTQGLVRRLLELTDGTFHYRAVREIEPDSLDVPVTTLLLAVMAEQDVLDQLSSKLPSADVAFAFTDQLVVLDNTLEAFVDRAGAQLEAGVTPRALAVSLDLDLKDVQLKVLQLLEVGLLAPVTNGSPSGEDDGFHSAAD